MEKNVSNQNDKTESDDQRFDNALDGSPDIIGRIVCNAKLHIFRKGFGQHFNFFFYIVHYVEGIGIRRLAQTDNDGGRIIKMGHHIITVRSQFNPGNIFEANYSPVGIGGNHNIFEIFNIIQQSLGGQRQNHSCTLGTGRSTDFADGSLNILGGNRVYDIRTV